jgi:hypothetical protein
VVAKNILRTMSLYVELHECELHQMFCVCVSHVIKSCKIISMILLCNCFFFFKVCTLLKVLHM